MRVFFALVLSGLIWSGAVRGENAPPDAARAVIERQLDAFARDDAGAAFALAAPRIQEMFGDTDSFMAMVKRGYAPVYRHRSIEFGEFTAEGDEAQQVVTIVDVSNAVWKALYKLGRQADGTWLVTGCVLTKAEESSI